jgi:membrane associated rhomboid family serine protease
MATFSREVHADPKGTPPGLGSGPRIFTYPTQLLKGPSITSFYTKGVKRSRCLSHLFAGILAGIHFGTHVAFAHLPESEFWAERRNRARPDSPLLLAGAHPVNILQHLPAADRVAAGLSPSLKGELPAHFVREHAALLSSLSGPYGSVRRVFQPPRPSMGPLVVHIQDVHMNADAQENIAGLLRELAGKKAVGLVALEGAFQPLDLGRYRAYHDRGAVQKTADYLLRENGISGPIHAAMTGAGEFPPLIGVDDPIHYQANVDAYKRSSPLLAERRRVLKTRVDDISRRKKRVFNAQLRDLDQKIQARRKDALSLEEYARALSAQVPSPPQVSLLVRTFDLEKSLDFNQVQADRAFLIEGLTRKLPPDEVQNLLHYALSYRLGRLRYADFYRWLATLCERNGVSLARFPAMDAYVRYVLLSDGIDAGKLFEALAALEKRALAALAKTEDERRLLTEDRNLYLASRLADFTLSPEEWGEYVLSRDGEGVPELSSFEDFYREAQARDGAMAERLLSSLRGVSSPAVLVTGGFHAPGLTERLIQAGCTVVNFVPKIEKLDGAQGAAYLSVFSQEKTPLEKLFQGEKLFLAQTPGKALPNAPAVVGSAEIWESAHAENANKVLEAAIKELSADLPGHTLEVSNARIEGDRVKASLHFTHGKNRETLLIDTRFDKEGSVLKAAQQAGREDLGPSSLAFLLKGLNAFYAVYLAPGVEYVFWLHRLPFMSQEEKVSFINRHRLYGKSEFLRKLSPASLGYWTAKALKKGEGTALLWGRRTLMAEVLVMTLSTAGLQFSRTDWVLFPGLPLTSLNLTALFLMIVAALHHTLIRMAGAQNIRGPTHAFLVPLLGYMMAATVIDLGNLPFWLLFYPFLIAGDAHRLYDLSVFNRKEISESIGTSSAAKTSSNDDWRRRSADSLLILCSAIFFMGWFGAGLRDQLVLNRDGLNHSEAWRMITYMFVHKDVSHMMNNLLLISLVGFNVVKKMGGNRFFAFYIGGGMFAGLFDLAYLAWMDPSLDHSLLGASGALFAILIAFIRYFPRVTLPILLPIRVAHVIVSALLLEFFLLSPDNQISHAAHLGGALFGMVYFLSDLFYGGVKKLWRKILPPNMGRVSEKKGFALADDLFLVSHGKNPSPRIQETILSLFPGEFPQLEEKPSNTVVDQIRFGRAFRQRLAVHFGHSPTVQDVERLTFMALRLTRSKLDYAAALEKTAVQPSEGIVVLVDQSIRDLNAVVDQTILKSQGKRIFWTAADDPSRRELEALLNTRGFFIDTEGGQGGNVPVLQGLPALSAGNIRDFNPEELYLLINPNPALNRVHSWSVVLPDRWGIAVDRIPGSLFENAVFLFFRQILNGLEVREIKLEDLKQDLLLAKKVAQFA